MLEGLIGEIRSAFFPATLHLSQVSLDGDHEQLILTPPRTPRHVTSVQLHNTPYPNPNRNSNLELQLQIANSACLLACQ